MFTRMHHTLCVAILSLTLLPACRSSGPPASAPAVNAVFDQEAVRRYYSLPPNGESPEMGDTRIHARCSDYREFAQRKRNKNWIEYWAVATFDIVQVQRGTWPENTLSFLTMSIWPTPESGIMVDQVLLYRPGVEFIFELRTDEQPARIVGQTMLPPKPD